MRSGRFPYPILAFVILAGCARPQILHVDDITPRRERSPEAVRLLLDVPVEPYRTIAVIRSRPSSLFRDVESLKVEVRAAAARLGADAVILGLSASGDGGGTAMSPDGTVVMHVSGSRELRVIGRAIVLLDRGFE